MGHENVDELAAFRAGESELEAFLEQKVEQMVGTTAEQVVAALGDLVSDVDRRALSGEFADFIVRQTNHALASGVWGWFDDDGAFLRDWGFDLDGICVPLSVWHGGQDTFVPVAHGEWLAARLGADPHIRAGDGHLSLSLSSYGEILDTLLEH